MGSEPRLIVLPASAWIHNKIVRGLARYAQALAWSISQFPGNQPARKW